MEARFVDVSGNFCEKKKRKKILPAHVVVSPFKRNNRGKTVECVHCSCPVSSRKPRSNPIKNGLLCAHLQGEVQVRGKCVSSIRQQTNALPLPFCLKKVKNPEKKADIFFLIVRRLVPAESRLRQSNPQSWAEDDFSKKKIPADETT